MKKHVNLFRCSLNEMYEIHQNTEIKQYMLHFLPKLYKTPFSGI